MGGPVTPNPHSERSEGEPEQREPADRGMGEVVGGTHPKRPLCSLLSGQPGLLWDGQTPELPTGTQNPPNPKPGLQTQIRGLPAARAPWCQQQ